MKNLAKLALIVPPLLRLILAAGSQVPALLWGCRRSRRAFARRLEKKGLPPAVVAGLSREYDRQLKHLLGAMGQKIVIKRK